MVSSGRFRLGQNCDYRGMAAMLAGCVAWPGRESIAGACNAPNALVVPFRIDLRRVA